jgi:heme-degrading monooxygenase HmoA
MVVVLIRTRPRPDADVAEYEKAGTRMFERASAMPGFISIKEYASEDGDTFSLACFESEDALAAWRNDPEHVAIQHRGREKFYQSYQVQVFAPVREYAWTQRG